MSNKLKLLILAVILFIITAVVIIANGNTYTAKIIVSPRINKAEEINIKIDDENIVKDIDKSIENGVLKTTFKSVSKGKTYVEVYNKDEAMTLFSLYVHDFGIITYNEYMGESSCSIVIPISIIVFLAYLVYLLIVKYRKNQKENLYQYKNIAYLGIIIFAVLTIISQVLALSNFKGVMSLIDAVLGMFSVTILLLPIAFILSILMIISNISLIRKEGFSITNLLGIALGGLICILSLLPEFMYNALYSATWIDIHNQNGIGVYIYNFAETTIHIILAYIECVLFGTIIMGIKAAKHIPQFDKDYIIILGCKIKQDGTITKLLKGRIDRAIEFSKMQKEATGKDLVFVASGGQGADEVISEAEAMKNYLLEQGFKEEQILVENKSKNTNENISFSNSLINNASAKIAFSTTNYHVFRAGVIASSQNIYAEGIGAKTKSYFWINAFIREFVATLFSEKKKHIAIILCIMVVAICMIALQYLFNVM